MKENEHLHVLWTSGNPVSAEKMVFMYVINSLAHGWWKQITLVIWGAPALLVMENEHIRGLVKEAQNAGAHVTACKACADQLGATQVLQELGVEVKYWGVPLTDILKNGEHLLTV